MEQSDFVHTGQKVGLVMASFVTPSTLAPSLSKRSWADQGIITGLSSGSSYLLALTAQDVIDVVAGRGGHRGSSSPTRGPRPPPFGGCPGLRAGHGAAGTRPRGLPRPAGRRDGQGGRPAAGRLADGIHGPLWLGPHRRDGRGAPARPGRRRRRAPRGAAPVDPRRPGDVGRHRARPARAGSEAGLDTGRRRAHAQGSRRRRRRARGPLRGRLGRAMDRRAGAAARPGPDTRCRARLAARLARRLRGRGRRRRQRPLDARHAADRGRDDDGGPVDARGTRRLDRPDDQRRPGEPRVVGLPRAGGPTARRHLRATRARRATRRPSPTAGHRPTCPSRR